MIKTNLILMGVPGVGKGTVASLISSQSDMIHVSTGDIFRAEIAQKTDLGLKVQSIVTTGGYVPDEITNAIVKKRIDELVLQNKFFILDGFPRTIAQAEFLDSLNLPFKVVELDAPEEIILERLSGRRTCPKCKSSFHIKFKPSAKEQFCDKVDCGAILIQRPDDQPEAISKRLAIYKEQTEPLLNFYNKSSRLINIEAIELPEKVAQKVLKILQK